jgi:hypothetical protein
MTTMIRLFFLSLLFPIVGVAQEGPTPLIIRAAYHNPIKPVAELYITDQAGGVVPLPLVVEGLSTPQVTLPVNGSLVLYKEKLVDPKNPQASVAASAKIPADWKKVIVMIFPAVTTAENPGYRILLINDAPNAFKKGESRVLNLTQADTAMQAGEHKIPLPSGKVSELPAVKKVNEYNMAQTNFYYKEGEEWVAFTERQLQYLDTTKRIFLIYLTPGSTQPFVTTIVDNTPEFIPKVQN